MRKVLAILFVLTAAVCHAASPRGYFHTNPGTTLRYERHEPGSDVLVWTHTSRIGANKALEDGSMKVDFTTTIVSSKGKSPLKSPVSSHVIIHPDGTVELDVSRAAVVAAKQRFSAFDFTASGGTSLLPASMKPGDTLKDIHAVVAWSGIKYTIDYTERQVLRHETVTVPAGTFECIVVREHKLEKAPLMKRDRITYTWYALGYGMIRHDTYFTNGSMETTEQLTSII
ncbi:MAG: hypothetical protein J5640_05795 [Bacteroidales bacterium]|nr:hypothetical protein [Bacteroidales bacterium]